MKNINEPLEQLCALVMIKNSGEVINKQTWFDAERVILENVNKLDYPVTKEELEQGFTKEE